MDPSPGRAPSSKRRTRQPHFSSVHPHLHPSWPFSPSGTSRTPAPGSSPRQQQQQQEQGRICPLPASLRPGQQQRHQQHLPWPCAHLQQQPLAQLCLSMAGSSPFSPAAHGRATAGLPLPPTAAPRPCAPSSSNRFNSSPRFHQQQAQIQIQRSSGERQFQALPASARSPACSQAFPSTLATLPCSPTANGSTTATVTATRPATTRFPDVSVSSSFSLLLSDCSYYFICDVIVE